MKLDKNFKDEEEKRELRTDIFIGGIELLLGVTCIVLLIAFGIRFANLHAGNTDREEKVAYIDDIYKENDLYFIDALIDGNGKVYKVEIDKNQFMKYKVSDEIEVVISNGKVTIIK